MSWPRRWSVAERRRRFRLPASLGGRTAFWLILALMLVQAAGLTIHALDRVDLQRFIQAREIAGRAFGAWRPAVLAPADRRAQLLAARALPAGSGAWPGAVQLRTDTERKAVEGQGTYSPTARGASCLTAR